MIRRVVTLALMGVGILAIIYFGTDWLKESIDIAADKLKDLVAQIKI